MNCDLLFWQLKIYIACRTDPLLASAAASHRRRRGEACLVLRRGAGRVPRQGARQQEAARLSLAPRPSCRSLQVRADIVKTEESDRDSDRQLRCSDCASSQARQACSCCAMVAAVAVQRMPTLSPDQCYAFLAPAAAAAASPRSSVDDMRVSSFEAYQELKYFCLACRAENCVDLPQWHWGQVCAKTYGPACPPTVRRWPGGVGFLGDICCCNSWQTWSN